jgi:hypothetical protein
MAVSDSDVLAVLNDLTKVLKCHLSNGGIVRFGDFGSFQVAISSEDAETAEKFNASLIKGGKVTFQPEIDLKENAFAEGELNEEDTVRKIGNSDFSTKPTNLYNLDVIISVGYRVKSLRGTQFRQWATKRLNEYIRKGFTMDDERLKNLGGGGYWKELLQRIRDIRASEKVFYRQVLDIYATSIDYDMNTTVRYVIAGLTRNLLKPQKQAA